jgi:phage-related protein
MKKEIFYTKYAIAFIETLSEEAQVKLDAIIDDLAEHGYLIAPHGEKVEGHKGLFEIRTKDASGQYRVFYVYAAGDEVYLLNGFVKKTQKTPPAEIKKALKIRKEMGL